MICGGGFALAGSLSVVAPDADSVGKKIFIRLRVWLSGLALSGSRVCVRYGRLESRSLRL